MKGQFVIAKRRRGPGYSKGVPGGTVSSDFWCSFRDSLVLDRWIGVVRSELESH